MKQDLLVVQRRFGEVLLFWQQKSLFPTPSFPSTPVRAWHWSAQERDVFKAYAGYSDPSLTSLFIARFLSPLSHKVPSALARWKKSVLVRYYPSSFQVCHSWGSQERWRLQKEGKAALQGSPCATAPCAAVSRSLVTARSLAVVLLSEEALLHVQKGKWSQTCQCSITSAFLSAWKTPIYYYSVFYIVLFLRIMHFLLKGQFTIFLRSNGGKMWNQLKHLA